MCRSSVRPGEIVGIVGESGSGKTMAVRAIIGLLPQAIRRSAGRILFEGRDLATLSCAICAACAARRIGMVFQEPMTSLNPALTIGRQLDEGLGLPDQAERGGAPRAHRRDARRASA